MTVEWGDGCDYGHNAPAVRLSTGAQSGVWLCRMHWDTEMRWRVERNKTLGDWAKFDILPFPVWTDSESEAAS